MTPRDYRWASESGAHSMATPDELAYLGYLPAMWGRCQGCGRDFGPAEPRDHAVVYPTEYPEQGYPCGPVDDRAVRDPRYPGSLLMWREALDQEALDRGATA